MLAIVCGLATAAVAAPASSPRAPLRRRRRIPGRAQAGGRPLQAGSGAAARRQADDLRHELPPGHAHHPAGGDRLDGADPRPRARPRPPRSPRTSAREAAPAARSRTQTNLEQRIAAGLAKGQALVLAGALGRSIARTAAVPSRPGGRAPACSRLEQARKERRLPRQKRPARKSPKSKAHELQTGEIEPSRPRKRRDEARHRHQSQRSRHRGDSRSLRRGRPGNRQMPHRQGQGRRQGHAKWKPPSRSAKARSWCSRRACRFKGETTVKAQTGDDGKLDDYDIKHIYSLVGSFGGSKTAFGPMTVDTTYIGEAHIDMRSGSQQAPPAVVDVMTIDGGSGPGRTDRSRDRTRPQVPGPGRQGVRRRGRQGDREAAQPGSRLAEAEHLRLDALRTGFGNAEAEEGSDRDLQEPHRSEQGRRPSGGDWTLGAQQNATFTPGGAQANPLSTSYDVTNAGKGLLVSATVKATSKAGVAEGTWKQKTESLIQTIIGTFSGTDDTGRGTSEMDRERHLRAHSRKPRRHLDPGDDGERGHGHGRRPRAGRMRSGRRKSQVPIFEKSVFSVLGEATPGRSIVYHIDAPFGFPGPVDVVFSGCPPKERRRRDARDGEPARRGAVLTGDASTRGRARWSRPRATVSRSTAAPRRPPNPRKNSAGAGRSRARPEARAPCAATRRGCVTMHAMPNRRPQFQLIAPSASPEEAAAVVAALERFMRATVPASCARRRGARRLAPRGAGRGCLQRVRDRSPGPLDKHLKAARI